MIILEQASLQDRNTMAVPATARYLLEAYSVSDIEYAVRFAAEKEIPIIVLGEGSNTLFIADVDALVLVNCLPGIEILSNDNEGNVLVKAFAGENWHDFVKYTIEQGWSGLENLALIPGLVGAAPIQNIGAYGVEVKDTIVSVDFFEFTTKKIRTFDALQCEFAYRDSIFKRELKNKGVITSVNFNLNKYSSLSRQKSDSNQILEMREKFYQPNISYPVLGDYFKHNDPSPNEVFDAVCDIRKQKLPLPKDIPNLGSFFKNPIISSDQLNKIKQNYPDIVSYSHGRDFKIAAAWLIDVAGWKARELNRVSVHSAQALVIINPCRMKGQDVLQFAEAIQADIKLKFAINLEIEPNIVV